MTSTRERVDWSPRWNLGPGAVFKRIELLLPIDSHAPEPTT